MSLVQSDLFNLVGEREKQRLALRGNVLSFAIRFGIDDQKLHPLFIHDLVDRNGRVEGFALVVPDAIKPSI